MSIVERDEQGRIVKKTLTSEEAKRLNKRRWAAPVEKNMASLSQLAGYDSAEDLPAHLRLFAEEFASGGPRSVQAGIQFVKTAGLLRRDGGEEVEGHILVSSLSPFLQNVVTNAGLAKLLESVARSPKLLKMVTNQRTQRRLGKWIEKMALEEKDAVPDTDD